MKEATFYTQIENEKIQCTLCPHNCHINEGKRGSCRVRKNINGKLIAENYEQVCSYSFDPIEKKPLYHFYPGQKIFSVGSIGCNLHCKFCQNWEISQTNVDDFGHLNQITAEGIVELADSRHDNMGIAFTYNEPIVWYEYMVDIAKLAHQKGLKTVMVTNGFINPKPLESLIPLIDAFSVDLKAFSEKFYAEITSAGLQPVLETLKTIRKNNKHLEITNLVITDLNDDAAEFKEMVSWIADELGEETVLHISRYHPMYKMKNEATSTSKLQELYEIAKEKLDYVYLGNVSTYEGQNTYCKSCREIAISRTGYYIEMSGLDKYGNCKFCGASIIGENTV